MIPGAAATMIPSSEAAKIYQTNYIRNSRAIGLLWSIFTILFAIVNVVCFMQPYWIGDGMDTPQTGYFGLFHYCIGDGVSRDLTCQGTFTDFGSIPSGAFKAASFFVGTSMVLVLSCIGCFILFFFCSTHTVYKICGWMQLASGLGGGPELPERHAHTWLPEEAESGEQRAESQAHARQTGGYGSALEVLDLAAISGV
ncbi:hypothetical protein ACEWY4_011275 [Coilia grayii]|uniref:Lipoma HMGIC fusion partner-like 3 protein n=1 Tax=Coilia grayii TaxID=363190 RepID=A0ABD1K4W3_9TELE